MKCCLVLFMSKVSLISMFLIVMRSTKVCRQHGVLEVMLHLLNVRLVCKMALSISLPVFLPSSFGSSHTLKTFKNHV